MFVSARLGRNMPMRTKLLSGFLCISLLLIGVGAVGIVGNIRSSQRMTVVAQQNVSSIAQINIIQHYFLVIERDFRQQILDQLRSTTINLGVDIPTDVSNLKQAISDYMLQQGGNLTAGQQGMFNNFEQWLNPWLDTLQYMETLHAQHEDDQLPDLINNVWDIKGNAALVALDSLIQSNRQAVNQAQAQTDADTVRITWIIAITSCLSVVVAVTLGLILTRLIVRRLNYTVAVVERVAAGDLAPIDSLLIERAGRDEIGQLLLSFQIMIAGLHQLIDRVRRTNQRVADVSTALGATQQQAGVSQSLESHQNNLLLQATAEIEEIDRLNVQLAEAYHTIHQQAITDPLTGLPNHGAIVEQVEQAVEHAQQQGTSFAVVFFDGDHFKRVNDTYGHAIGDAVLLQLGERARQVLRANDVIGRYGGEEFVVLLPNIGRTQAMAIAQRLRSEVAAAPLVTKEVDGGIPVTISVGLALFPEHGTTAHEVLVQADQAMYWAKKLGRNQVRLAGELPNIDEQSLAHSLKSGNDRVDLVLPDVVQLASTLQAERDGCVQALLTLIEAHDPAAGAHSRAVSTLAAAVAREHGCDEATIHLVTQAALLHEIDIVGMQGSTSTCSDIGAGILGAIPFLRQIMPLVRHHHERWDGTGQPDGLKGDQIPLGARIIAVAHAYHTLANEDSHQARRSQTEAIARIERHAGSHFDPALVKTLVQVVTRSEHIAA